MKQKQKLKQIQNRIAMSEPSLGAIISVHSDRSISLNVSLDRSHRYENSNFTPPRVTPSTNYAVYGQLHIPLGESDPRSIHEILNDPATISALIASLQASLDNAIAERDAFVEGLTGN